MQCQRSCNYPAAKGTIARHRLSNMSSIANTTYCDTFTYQIMPNHWITHLTYWFPSFLWPQVSKENLTTVRPAKQEQELAKTNALATLNRFGLFMDRNNIGSPGSRKNWDNPVCAKQHHLSHQRWWQKPTPSAPGLTGEIRIDTKLLSSEVSALESLFWAQVPRKSRNRNMRHHETMTSTFPWLLDMPHMPHMHHI